VWRDCGPVSSYELGRLLGVSGSTMRRMRDEGLTTAEAERLAARRGLHPTELWPTWPRREQGLSAPEGERYGRDHPRRRVADVGVEDEAWRESALCRSMWPPSFFGLSEESQREAAKVCRSCTVREKCLDYALRNRIHDGVWGGTTERDRRRIRRRRRAG
jgi:WhiB family redox-sensing transcriptional regulator